MRCPLSNNKTRHSYRAKKIGFRAISRIRGSNRIKRRPALPDPLRLPRALTRAFTGYVYNSLPQLYISQESSPAWETIVCIQLLYVFCGQFATSRQEICRLWIAPRCPEDELVPSCHRKDQDDTNRILEEVIGGRARFALLTKCQ